jgi:DNA polymerase elongation subunit (family B)
VPAAQLLITNRLSRKPGEYRSRQAVALAARALEARGVALAPGESIEYILTAGGGARPFEAWTAEDRYDVARYEELFVRMLETLAVPTGLGRKEILERLTGIGQPELLASAAPLPLIETGLTALPEALGCAAELAPQAGLAVITHVDVDNGRAN